MDNMINIFKTTHFPVSPKGERLSNALLPPGKSLPIAIGKLSGGKVVD
jgi:hypothetical protein